MKNGFGEEKAYQGIKGGLTRRKPVPSRILLCKVDKRASNVQVVRNESSIEVGEAKEGMYILDFSQSGPACDAIKFNRVHG